MADPVAVMAYVASNNTNDLLVTTSDDGVHWSPPRRTGQATSLTPALVTFGEHLVLVFAPQDPPHTMMYCTSKNAIDWSPSRPVAWGTPQGSRIGWIAGQDPALVAYKHPEGGNHLHLFYAADYSMIHYCTAKPVSREGLEFEFVNPNLVLIEDKVQPEGLRRFSHGRRAFAVLDDKLIMVFVKTTGDTLCFSTPVDAGNIHTWQSPQYVVAPNIVNNVADPAITVLSNQRLVHDRWEWRRKAVVAWRYEDGTNRLGVATIADEGKVRDFANTGESSRRGPALTAVDTELFLAFVANNDSNELLVCSSWDGLKWSPSRHIGQSSKTAPALATAYF